MARTSLVQNGFDFALCLTVGLYNRAVFLTLSGFYILGILALLFSATQLSTRKDKKTE